MRKKFITVVAISMILMSCGETQEAKKQELPSVEVVINEVAQVGENSNHTASLAIDGMTCAMGCAKTIENKLKSMEGVISAEVDFEKTVASIEFDHSKTSANNFIAEISSIHDGQYSVTKASVDKPVK